MALRKKGKYCYGDLQLDIREELMGYSELNEYLATQYADAECACGGKVFNLSLDENEGAAVRKCIVCKTEHPIGDSDEYLEDAELEECECICKSSSFEITVGIALYENSEDVKWVYIGCRCINCGLTACYGDWKNEYQDYREYISRI